ncbi:MAG: DUF4252 domain-containing protein [Bacteroidales bacterium]|nr:DUF4252 domain-containing protein [Bacteroidales bacterium]
MTLIRLITVFTLFSFVATSYSNGQSAKAKKLYKHYESVDGAKIKTISKDLIIIGLAFTKTDPSVTKVISDLKSLRILTIKNKETGKNIESLIPGKKMTFKIDNSNKMLDVWVKRCFFKVKEAHLLINNNRNVMLISAFGNFKIKDLKEMNKNFIQKGGLKNIPLSSNFLSTR